MSSKFLPPKTPLHQQLLGKTGEDYASAYLQKKGYSILERNFKARYGEVDIIVQAPDKKILVFVEVKTRMGRAYGLPEEAVTPKKLREVIQTAQYYILTHEHRQLPLLHRIDVIGIEYNEQRNMIYFRHIENVTG